MKSTKIMLAVIATFIITWLTLGLTTYLLTSMSYKECLIYPGIIGAMVIIGWIPSMVVGLDLLDEKL